MELSASQEHYEGIESDSAARAEESWGGAPAARQAGPQSSGGEEKEMKKYQVLGV